MCSAWWPQRFLCLERPNHRIVIEHIHSPIQSAKPRLVRKQLCQRNFFFASLCKFRPEFCYAPVEVDLMFLQCVQDTRAADSFRRRPDQDKCVARPRIFATRISKSAVEIDDRLSILPNRYRGAEFAKRLEILLKQRLQSLKKLAALQLHLIKSVVAGVPPATSKRQPTWLWPQVRVLALQE